MKHPKRKIILILIIIVVFLIRKPACYFPEEEITVTEPVVEDIAEQQQFLEENKIISLFHTGMSMYPFIKQGQICLCEKSDTYEINDIVAFYDYYDKLYFISHRIINILPNGEIITKGDNNEKADSKTIPNEQIFCKIKEENLFERLT